MSRLVDMKLIASKLRDDVERVVHHLFPNGKKVGIYWVTGDIYDTPASNNGSFKIALSGKKQGMCRDFNGDDTWFDLLDAWYKRFNIDKKTAAMQAVEFLGMSSIGIPSSNPVKVERKPKAPLKAQPIRQSWTDKLVSRLKSNQRAMHYLASRSLKLATIEEFKLGLSTPYTNSEGITSSDALVFPMRCEDGSFISTNGYYCIPDVTENPTDRNGWMKGAPQVYFTHAYRKQKKIFVCEGVKDAWVVYQNLKENNLLQDILVCSGTHGSSIPDVMRSEGFWSRFEKIYLGHDHDSAGDRMAEKLSELILKDCYRVKCPASYAPAKYSADGTIKPDSEWGADWTDFFKADSCIEEFLSLLNDSPICATKIDFAEGSNNFLAEGRFNVAPVDINGAYINERMYYPVQTLVRKKEIDEYGVEYFSERYETVVVRSDATVHKAIKSPAPRGTPDSERVIRLSDGTLIRSEPKPNDFCTWKWSNIEAYINRKVKVRSTRDIFDDVYNTLKKAVWLPVKEDYVILSLTVLATYVQNVFESVPILFLNGQAGTGKSQTGIIMAKLSCNGSVIGQVSAATAARHIDAARGFVVFDDLEGVASKGGKDGGQFSELVQALKVSYNKNTAEKIWTDVKTMKTERLNFFGIKLISNTSGADDILSTRMLRIQTRHMPDSEKGTIKKLNATDFTKIEALRQELHSWGFMKCAEIEEQASRFNEKSGRFDEIALPLRVIAKMVSDECSKELEVALSKQRTVVIETSDPVETLKEAVKNLIKEGFIRFTVTQVILELRTLLDENFGADMTNSIPEWQRPEWVGRQLRTLGLLDSIDLGRTTFYGKRLKVMQFNDHAINEVIEELGATIELQKDPFDFCKGCSSCPYSNSYCEFKSHRLQQEQKDKIKYN